MQTTELNDNFAILTGILFSKERNADSKLLNLKRPVLDLEVICYEGETPVFESVAVIVVDTYLAKISNGYKIGDIITVTGKIRCTGAGVLYVEAMEIEKNYSAGVGEDFTIELIASRMKLIEKTPKFNLAHVCGKVTHQADKYVALEVERTSKVRGDLQENDVVLLNLSRYLGLSPEIGDRIYCFGEIGGEDEKSYIYPSSLRKVM